MWKNSCQVTLFNIRIPSVDVGIIMMKFYMPDLPDITIGAHQVKEMNVGLIQIFVLKNSAMDCVVNNIEENKYQQKAQ